MPPSKPGVAARAPAGRAHLQPRLGGDISPRAPCTCPASPCRTRPDSRRTPTHSSTSKTPALSRRERGAHAAAEALRGVTHRVCSGREGLAPETLLFTTVVFVIFGGA